ncbi:TOM (translocase of outer membrane) complex component [Phlyctochytrium bullatum]|nr:TOM (translocase of outer membrane) complex component [Phlyctochytrium bullatum]
MQDQRTELSQKAKAAGNKYFAEKKYEEAKKLYTQALALKEDAMKDYTAICMLEEFKKEASIASTDRILKEIGKKKSDEIWKTKVARLPSETFINAYMDSFRETKSTAQRVLKVHPERDGDRVVLSAFQAIVDRNWQTAMDLILSVGDDEISEGFKAEALNLAATFSFLKGEVENAEGILKKSLALHSNSANAYIKMASICMERGDIEAHRVEFLTGNLAEAIDDYRASLALDDDFVYAHIQLGVALYKSGEQSQATLVFEKARRKFPESPEIYNYYGELLIDQQSFEEAILYLQWKRDAKAAETFCRKALEVDPLCDMAYIQLAQLLIQQNDFEAAIQCYDEAAAAAQAHTSSLYPDVYAKLRSFM